MECHRSKNILNGKNARIDREMKFKLDSKRERLEEIFKEFISKGQFFFSIQINNDDFTMIFRDHEKKELKKTNKYRLLKHNF